MRILLTCLWLLIATPVFAGSTFIVVNWNANTEPDLNGYHIKRCVGVSCSPSVVVQTPGPTSTIVVDTGLSPSTLYCYSINSFDTSNNTSADSSVQCLTTLASSGTIASNYNRDAGIGSDPAVVFSENFESSLATWSARFNGGDATGVSSTTDHSSDSGGTQAALLIPSGIAGTLYRQLSTDYTELYMRYYVKYFGNVSHHAGSYIGGYSPPSSFPQGDAGLKGVRANGDKLFIASLEQAGSGDAISPQTHLGTYMNWVDMQGPAFNGLYFGRDYLVTENPPLRVNLWQCVEIRQKLNTTATGHEGELQFWINDTQIQNFIQGSPIGSFDAAGNWDTGTGSAYPGFQWRDVLTYGINWIKLQNYSDVGTPYNVAYDDLVVATSRIGCINIAPPDTIPPGSPTNLVISAR